MVSALARPRPLCFAAFAALTAAALSACGVDADADGPVDRDAGAFDAADVHRDARADSGAEGDEAGAVEVGDPHDGSDTGTDGSGADADTESDADAATDADTATDVSPLLALRAHGAPPRASVVPASLQSCAILDQTACIDGHVEVCSVWNNGAWADTMPRAVEQAYAFDRYYDLYHQAEGQAIDVRFTRPVPQGTPEAEWSRPEYFEQMDAYGDAAGWTGTALWAGAARYLATGTDADYQRLLGQFRAMMRHYEVTGIDGMIARSHFGLLEPGAPLPVGHWGRALSPWFQDDGSGWHFHYPITGAILGQLPAYYEGGVDIDGTHYDTTPRWMGDASRDMYVRSLPGITLAYEVLGEGQIEDQLRASVRRQIPCTLNRMKRGVITNLQSRPDLIDGVTALLGGGAFVPDAGDFDLTTLDTLVFFVMEQPNPAHMELFDPDCPDGPPDVADAEYAFDAAEPTFLLDLVGVFARMERTSERPIAWIQFPSVRAADLVFMLQWGLLSEYFTDDPRYLAFVARLIEEIPAAGVLSTWGSYGLPKWCQSHYAPSLAYPSLYNLLARMDHAAMLGRMLSVTAYEELVLREMAGRDDAFFGVLYHRMWTPSVDPDGLARVSDAIAILDGYGIDPANPREPDRNIRRNWVDPPIEGLALETISDAERALCEAPISVLGIEFEAPGVSDTAPRAVEALPLSMRTQSGFMWTGDPWRVVYEPGAAENTIQYPMLGQTAAYWIGRADGRISDGALMGLAWRALETSCE